MRKELFISVLAVTSLVSCTSSSNGMEELLKGRAVGFDTYVSTKGVTTDLELLKTEGFGVFAYHHVAVGQTEAGWDGTGTPDFMDNQKVTYSSPMWVYNPVKYWPNNSNDRVSFFAYGPYDAAQTIITENCPKIKHSLSTSEKMVDLIGAVPVYNAGGKSPNNNTVDFHFKHLLTRVKFSAKVAGSIMPNSPETKVYVTNLQLVGTDNKSLYNRDGEVEVSTNFVKEATFSFSTQADIDMAGNGVSDAYVEAVGNWEATSLHRENLDLAGEKVGSSYPGVFAKNTNVNNPTGSDCFGTNNLDGVLIYSSEEEIEVKSLFKNNEYLYLIPPTAEGVSAAASDQLVYIEYYVVSKSEDGKTYTQNENHDILSLPKDKLRPGKAYNFTFALNLGQVILEPSIDDWVTEEDDTIVTPK